MSDLISRNEAYNAIIRHSQLAYRIATDEMGNDDALLDSIKFSDDFVVEVVRCRECKHENINLAISNKGTWCTYWGIDPDLDDYCSYGERKEVSE